MGHHVMDKVVKLLITLSMLSLSFPLVFTKKEVIHYATLGDKVYYQPRMELFAIPVCFIILLFLYCLWQKEIYQLFGKTRK